MNCAASRCTGNKYQPLLEQGKLSHCCTQTNPSVKEERHKYGHIASLIRLEDKKTFLFLSSLTFQKSLETKVTWLEGTPVQRALLLA